MVHCVDGKDPIVAESCEIAQMIKDTPIASKYEVDLYHKLIIQRLDSEKIIPVPSIDHRQAHQQIWLMAFTIYNNYPDTNSAFMDFLTKPARDKNGEYTCERERFDIHYDKFYIEPYLGREDQRLKWAKDTDIKIRIDVQNGLHKSLEEVAVAID